MAEDKTLMTRPGEEIWETTVEGMTWLKVADGRGGVKDVSVVGVSGQLSVTKLTGLKRDIKEAAQRVTTQLMGLS